MSPFPGIKGGRAMNGESAEGDPRLLTCWKDIANYLGKGVRTVQRWEREYGLPVRRPSGVHYKSTVIAHARDLDAWVEAQWSQRETKTEGNGASQLGMTELIQISRELRFAHQTLMEETSAAVELLVESCKQLESTRAAKATSPPWRFDERDIPGSS